MTITGFAIETREAANDRGIVVKRAIAVQLDEIREEPLRVIERVRPQRMCATAALFATA